MDTLLSFVTDPIKQLITECVVQPLKRHASYPFTYKTNLKNLSEQFEKLKAQRHELQLSVHQATTRGDEIKSTVQKWLADANEAIGRAENVIAEEDLARQKFCIGLIPNLKKLYQLSKKAEAETSVIQNLEKDAELGEISYRPNLIPVAASSVSGEEELGSRKLILKQVVAAVADPHTNVVGVHGMAGVGKSTLAEHVERWATESQLFDHVFRANVSPAPNLDEIRQQFADTLGLKFEEETSVGKALRLNQTLMNKKRILFILDDIWEELRLQEIGIPSGNYHKGCKLLLTSREKYVLSVMGAKTVFELDVLSESEAWSLFSKAIGEFKSDEVRSIAVDVAKKCGGLPLLIVASAKALKDAELHEWKDAFRELSLVDSKGSLTAVVRPVLELSYSHLANDGIKPFFLLCGQLGQSHISIEDVLKYSVGLSLLQGLQRMEDCRIKVLTWISHLKASCLLLDSNMDGFVKIHDLFRDTALAIASRHQPVYSMKSDGSALNKWPEEDALKNCSRVCLPFCDFQELPQRLECQKLEFLMLGFKYHSLSIPENFFEGLNELKVLHFSKIKFSSFPKSLGSLTKLSTLCFNQCKMDDIAITAVGGLKSLKVLSFANSVIRNLPKEVGQLSRLKVLDLSECRSLKFIPADVISSLSALEELYMMKSFTDWRSDKTMASLSELEGLSRLTTLEVGYYFSFPKALFSIDLARYKIWDCSNSYSPNEDEFRKFSRVLSFIFNDSFSKEPWIKVMTNKTEALSLYVPWRRSRNRSQITDLSFDQCHEIFPQLKFLHVEGGRYIKSIINSRSCKAFPALKFLCLKEMPNLEKICHGGIAMGSFNNLTTIKIERCNKLKNLFPLSVVRGISRLEILEVESCDNLTSMLVDETNNPDDGSAVEMVVFSHLRKLKFVTLPRLQSFCCRVKTGTDNEIVSEDELGATLFNKMVAFPGLEELHITRIDKVENIWLHSQLAADSFGKLKSLTIVNCSKLETIFPFDVVGRFLKFEDLSIWYCDSVKQICRPQEGITIEETPIFPSLKTLDLQSMKHLSNGNFQCPSLKKIRIYNCPQLKKLISMEQTNDDEQIVESFFSNKQMPPNLEELSLDDYKSAKTILQSQLPLQFLCQIKSLHLSLGGKSVVSLPSMLQRFPNLEKLHLGGFSFKEEPLDFDKKNSIVPAGRIKELKLQSVYKLKDIWKLYPFDEKIEIISLTFCYDLTNLAMSSRSLRNLTTLELSYCRQLKNLVTPSAAKSMVQLVKMTVQSCDGLVEIVNNEQGGVVDEIVFEKLEVLELSSLKILSFCSSSCTLKFPSLEQVSILSCPNMEVFCKGDLSTPKLRRVLSGGEGGFQEWHWKGNLNDTIKQMFVEMVMGRKSLQVSRELLGQIPVVNMEYLNHLEVYDSGLFSNAIPFNVLQGLGRLGSLTITKCKSIEEVFDLEDLNVDEEVSVGFLSNLVGLSLTDLPQLRHVWNPDHFEVLGFNNLERLEVHNCDNLKFIFTFSMAVGLTKLRSIKVSGCMLLEQVIAKEAEEAELDNSSLPSLYSASLENLPRLTGFYSGSGILHCPSLEVFDVINCPKLKPLVSTFSSVRIEEDKETLPYRNSDVHIESQVAIPNLEQLTVDWQKLREMWHENFGTKLFARLKYVKLTNFLGENPNFPSDFLLRLPNLVGVTLSGDDSLEDIFLHEMGVSEEKYLKLLKLSKLQNLKHLVSEDSPTVSAFQYLDVGFGRENHSQLCLFHS